ncbi:MAG: hypothetical protein H7202_02740 [Pedobacter sp.]|nr:hypothetical protein [Pedobacter sp.]
MRLTGICFLIFLLHSCTPTEQNKTQKAAYFSLKNYFEKETERLNGLNLQIHKTVAINGINEHKLVKINNFKNELNTFISSDINKASWRGAFIVKKDEHLALYTTENKKIPVKKLEIRFQNNKVKSIQIFLRTVNILYYSSDTLTYFPDSLYEIKKTQKIKLLKEKKYVVIGKFK